MTLPLRIGFCLLAMPAFAASDLCDPRAFGAHGDGATLDTAPIQRAIDACAEAGGGTVRLGPGRYVSGTLVLRSHITLRLEQGAVLAGSPRVSDYLPGAAVGLGTTLGVDVAGEGTRAGLLAARDATDIAIEGPGTIDGGGAAFFTDQPHLPADYDPRAVRDPEAFEAAMRDPSMGPLEVAPGGRPGVLVLMLRVRDLTVRDVRLVDSPNWTLVLQSVERARIDGIAILNDPRLPNNDGIDCNGCADVHIANATIRAGDDAIAVSGSRDLTVTGVTLGSRSAAIRLESTRRAVFSGLAIDANRGIALFASAHFDQPTDGVIFSDVTMRTHLLPGHWWGKAEPIYVATQPPAPGRPAGAIRNVTFSDIDAEAEAGAVIAGARGAKADGITLRDVRLRMVAPDPALARAVGGNFDRRWTAATRAEGVTRHDIPAIWAEWTRGLTLRDVRVTWDAAMPDYMRGAVAVADSSDLVIDGLEERGPAPGGASLSLTRVSDAWVTRTRLAPDRPPLAATDVTGLVAPGLTGSP